ncbi:MAG: hypothetical protein AAFU65_16745, partial [Pseudomonadota bacterium]
CYVISAAAGVIPVCLTYLEGCTSISSTGRHGVGYVLFKLAMLPQAWLLFDFWSRYTAHLDPADAARATRVARRAGQVGAVFLVIYVLTLGADTPLYAVMRRYGVFVFFIGTFVAMCCMSHWHWRRSAGAGSTRAFAALCAGMLLLGLAEIPLGKFGLADNQAENIIEWNFALLMQSWFFVAWRRRQ